MIPLTPQRQHILTWQQELASGISSVSELLQLLGLQPSQIIQDPRASKQFRLRVPRSFVARMQAGNPHDPLLKQVLPDIEEMNTVAGYTTDPVGDLSAMPVPGLLHKYKGRVLLVTTGACAVHCRYCFRRHFPYSEANPSTSEWTSALHYIQQEQSINEVILSGGDPLMLSDKRLEKLSAALQKIPHLKRLRLHTRLPVVLPSRVDTQLLTWLNKCRLQKIVVVHINHANEINAEVADALQLLASAGCRLFNQAVLLNGVNATLQCQTDLSEALFTAGVQPYYLHLVDKVQGAAHFEVTPEVAINLITELAANLPGYLVPKLVTEIPGEPAKSPVHPFG